MKPLLSLSAIPALIAAAFAFIPTGAEAAGAGKDTAAAGSWPMYGLTPGETRFSPLKQIDASNVGKLGLSWSYVVGAGGGNQEGTPLVWNNTIYGITTYSVVFAVDARTGKQVWRWDPEVNQKATRDRMCCGVVNRGLALSSGLIIAPVNDGRLVALDAMTGKVKWEARVAFPQNWYTLTMAPRIAGNKVVVGVAGGDHPIRGFFDAYDIATGRRVWRFYTVPGDPSKGFEDEAQRAAAKTWSGEWWKWGGGGSVWDGMAYDQETNTVFAGTGNAEPWPEKFRGSKGLDNLYTCSIVAVDANTGKLKWYYQEVPDDNWDLDSVGGFILTDLKIKGRTRKVILHAPKDGVFYVLDRVTGEFISAAPFVQVNWTKGFDEKTGRPFINQEAFYDDKTPVQIYPTGGGAHNWAPMSYNPETGLVYLPASQGNYMFRAADEVIGYPFGHPGIALGPSSAKPVVPPIIGPEPLPGTRGVLEAWDPVNQKLVWRVAGGGASGGGTVTTAANLVFQVTNDGRLLAYSADKGEKLLEIHTNRFGAGPPITYMVDGKQYVAFVAGTGRPPQAEGPTDAKVDGAPMLFAFEVGGTAALPAPPPPGRGRGGAPPPSPAAAPHGAEAAQPH
ncbi:MAG TPA: PQQ-dependent dehydrogenase, methanol/ethanol family [Bryobacteraceae bacterium]|nr:PQQ-dependent dehydrogenase, methanol/ethanol family [Bryobacteraceae bacterium]